MISPFLIFFLSFPHIKTCIFTLDFEIENNGRLIKALRSLVRCCRIKYEALKWSHCWTWRQWWRKLFYCQDSCIKLRVRACAYVLRSDDAFVFSDAVVIFPVKDVFIQDCYRNLTTNQLCIFHTVRRLCACVCVCVIVLSTKTAPVWKM